MPIRIDDNFGSAMKNTVTLLKKESVVKYLKEMESRRGISIIHACEVGSRLYGLSSPCSDYDVKFVYYYPKSKYLSLSDPLENIVETEDDMSFTGWGIKKSLMLAGKSNPSLAEFVSSDIVYFSQKDLYSVFEEAVRINNCLGILKMHYLNMTKDAFYEISTNPCSVKVKKYLNVLRSLLSCIFIQENNALPPMDFNTLFNQTFPKLPLINAKEISDEMSELINIKKTSGGSIKVVGHYSALDSFIHNYIRLLCNLRDDVWCLEKRTFKSSYDLDKAFLFIIEYGSYVW